MYVYTNDTIGPMARTVEDCALLLQQMAGFDTRDSTCLDREVPDYSAALNGSLDGLRIGLPKEYFGGGCQALKPEKLMDQRYEKFRRIGMFHETAPERAIAESA